MPQKITEKAILTCDKGVKPSSLKVTSQQFCMAENKLIATEQDIAPEVNIPNFGMCSITRSQCVPAPTAWDKTTSKDTINDLRILTTESYCQCAIGGKISVQHKGFGENHELP
ncbi:DUF4280 domain-containing protein [Chitinophaga sp. HK235]|uniref:DUF4280 domain-containing protein n=1 Tax=Chitinophaga sp. HK235 TaxID=2952571 RepID=UPI001BAE4CF3|nr:DUF4280 domain-containing protein [Chitinophaga sp. HK235]